MQAAHTSSSTCDCRHTYLLSHALSANVNVWRDKREINYGAHSTTAPSIAKMEFRRNASILHTTHTRFFFDCFLVLHKIRTIVLAIVMWRCDGTDGTNGKKEFAGKIKRKLIFHLKFHFGRFTDRHRTQRMHGRIRFGAEEIVPFSFASCFSFSRCFRTPKLFALCSCIRFPIFAFK